MKAMKFFIIPVFLRVSKCIDKSYETTNGSVSRIYCRGSLGDCGVSAKNNRLFLEAVLWIVRAGAPWRDLPESFAHWYRIYVRYNRWSHKGVWNRVFAAVIDAPDFECLMIDGSIVRVHQHGAARKEEQAGEAEGSSRGGLSAKIHAAVDALGNPVRLLVTAAQASEYAQADALRG